LRAVKYSPMVVELVSISGLKWAMKMKIRSVIQMDLC